ncbi:leucyl/phenylalanyl-tRNA--protein transferase [Halomonas sabkhae]|uniref:leucyl/phenylalanyl-tRNA--protein transferase n=1 Tax=Halomonas sabkhae TaxID=626223 RepID=UPI0025B617BF|nr:leucyl/phenylalanyl-tRNA--protein transferase [Halomonas sabkhae]MDN3526096.1 leucyl/phenylalanyl-tRNA--protein transferase [Halomonas sabkhae]
MLPWLPEHPIGFPAVETALDEPDGLLAAGGNLTPDWLLAAYRRGIFPWYSDGQPLLWWSPDPRMVLFPERIRVRRSLAKRLRNAGFDVTADRAFRDVIEACAAPRDGEPGTWITEAMRDAYCRLHALGAAHSIEVWHDARLVGGLYGIALGPVFFGESMFSRTADASKVALVSLAGAMQRGDGRLIDCQMHTPHLASLGAEDIARSTFVSYLDQWLDANPGEASGQQAAMPAASWSFAEIDATG